MSFTAEKALQHRVVMLTGDEETLRRRALAELVALAAPASDDFDLQTFDAGGSTPLDWLASAGTAPFLAERRTVVVRHLLRCEEPPLADASMNLANLPEYGLLILVADDEMGDDQRQRKFSTIRKSWEGAVKAARGQVAVFVGDAKGLTEALRQEALRLGVTITPGATQILAEMTGGSLSRGLDELEKLLLFVGLGAQIREADVRAVVMPSREWNVFRMVDAVTAGDAADAITQLRVLVGSAVKAEDAAFSRILPMMSRQFRLLWQARLCVDARTSVGAAPPEVIRAFPGKPNIGSEQPYRQQKLLASARTLDLVQIQRCFQELSDADSKLKGMLPYFSAMETLETMLLQMIEIVRPPVAAKR